MLTLILVVIFTVREQCGGILDLFGLPGYGHYDDPERHIHHAFPASEAIVSPTNVAHRSNSTIRNGGVSSNLGSGGFRCGCGCSCGCGCDATGVTPVGTDAVGAVPNSDTDSDSDSDSDSHSSESNNDGEYYSDIGDLSNESDSNSDDDNNDNDGNNSVGNVGSDFNGNNDDDNTDNNININGIIDYNDGTISYGIIRDALNGQNNDGTDNDTEAVNSSRFGNAFVCGNNGLLTDMYLGFGDVDDGAVIGIFDLVRDIYHRTGDVHEDGNYAGDMDRMCIDPFSEICH